MTSQKKIKILYVIDSLFKGGTENQLIELINNLPTEVISSELVILNDFDKFLLDKITCPVRILKKTSIFFKFFFKFHSLWKILKKNKYDIIQTQFIESELFICFVLKMIRQKPYFIITRRNSYHWINTRKLIFFLHKTISVKKCDLIITNSFKTKQECCILENVRESKIKVIHNSIDIDRFTGIKKDNARKKLKFSNTDIVIGVVANWRPVKGLKFFLESAKMLTASVDNVKFVLAGSGEQGEELSNISKEFGIEKKVHFFENYQNIPELIATFDIAVQPSTSESFSNVWLEYMISELPVIATKVGDSENVFDDNKDGILIQPDNIDQLYKAMLFLCKNKEVSLAMGNLAKIKVQQKWALPIINDAYLKLYESLC
ncbi:MAG: glycosyltransferase [Pseudomonadota bacterium]